jgi:hypothetical protein
VKRVPGAQYATRDVLQAPKYDVNVIAFARQRQFILVRIALLYACVSAHALTPRMNEIPAVQG